MRRLRYSSLNTPFKTAMVCLALATPARSMVEPEDCEPTSTSSSSSTSTSVTMSPAVEPSPRTLTENELRMQKELDQMSPETFVVPNYFQVSRIPDVYNPSRKYPWRPRSDAYHLYLSYYDFKSVDVRANSFINLLTLNFTLIDSPTRIIGLNRLRNLRTLYLRECPLKNLDGISACQNL